LVLAAECTNEIAVSSGPVRKRWRTRSPPVPNPFPTSSPLGDDAGLRDRDGDGDVGPKQLATRSANVAWTASRPASTRCSGIRSVPGTMSFAPASSGCGAHSMPASRPAISLLRPTPGTIRRRASASRYNGRETARYRQRRQPDGCAGKSLNDVGKGGASQPAKGREAKKAASGQRGMLMVISGKGEAKAKGAGVGNSTGMSPGFSPFRILSTESAPRRKYADMSGPYEAKPPSST
jgi:hypothetical protein